MHIHQRRFDHRKVRKRALANPQGSARPVRESRCPTQEGKVCLYGFHTLDKQRGATADNGESASNPLGTAASKHQPTPSVPRTHEEPIHTLSTTVKLLRKGVGWRPAPEKAFKAAKEQLNSDNLLLRYDPSWKLFLTCDASPYGLGAVLAHTIEDRTERRIEFASRTLTPA